MLNERTRNDLAREVGQFVLEGFEPHYGQLKDKFPSHPAWRAMLAAGSELWLDSGSLNDIGEVWTREFSAVTTNNTLLNKEIQLGTYDSLIPEAARLLEPFGLSDPERMLEMAFILNARHGLKLVETFDAMVSVEEHTALADDADLAVWYAHRYFELCPERFYIKLPFTPAGVLATHRLIDEGVAVNHTLGFSARQAMLAAKLARPTFVNVFLGRLNQFVIDNNLGDGQGIGEKATLAAQAVVSEVRRQHGGIGTRQIAASFRNGRQVLDLAGVDVLTIPPKVAKEFLALNVPPEQIRNRTADKIEPRLNQDVDPRRVRLETLWEVSQDATEAASVLMAQDLNRMTPDRLVDLLAENGAGDVLFRWTPEHRQASQTEGKIPHYDTWAPLLRSGKIGLDALMNLAGLSSFITDQKAMDDRVRDVLGAKAK